MAIQIRRGRVSLGYLNSLTVFTLALASLWACSDSRAGHL